MVSGGHQHTRPRFTCYVMEAHKSGADVCAALAEGTKRAFQSLVATKRNESSQAAVNNSGTSTPALTTPTVETAEDEPMSPQPGCG